MKLNNSMVVNSVPVCKIRNSGGLQFSFYENGCLNRITQESIQINLFTGSPLDSGCSNIYIRNRGEELTFMPLFGPKSTARQTITDDIVMSEGMFEGVSFSCRLLLSGQDSSWLWDIRVENISNDAVEVDFIYVQDIGLVTADDSEKNESYVSQYIDYTPINHSEYGDIVCCRQNEHNSDSVPWLALGGISGIRSYSTDGLQFFAPRFKEAGIPQGLLYSELDGLLQQEFAVVALQAEPLFLEPADSYGLGFFGLFSENHSEPSSQKDMFFIDEKLKGLAKVSSEIWPENEYATMPTKSVFSESPFFISEDLTEEELDIFFDSDRRHCEFSGNDLLSFFYGKNRHVVMRNKEFLVDRPHGHIMRTGTNLTPVDQCMSFTSYMFGVFLSHVAQGNVNLNRLFTLNSNSLNLLRYTGQRIFAKLDGCYFQLGVPSAFEMTLNGCRWIYKKGEHVFQVSAWASTERHEISLCLEVIKGEPVEWLITHQLTAKACWNIEMISASDETATFELSAGNESELDKLYPNASYSILLKEAVCLRKFGGDELVFNDRQSRGMPFLVFDLTETKKFEITVIGELVPREELLDKSFALSDLCTDVLDEGVYFWQDMSLSLDVRMSVDKKTNGLDEIFEMLPWFAQNAQIHYLAPHGLEQYSGAAWGTRDISQGPLEMLLSLGLYAQAKTILRTIFSNQNEDGNWPQWWMFDRYRWIRSDESHGDVIFWPILALSEYVKCSNDVGFLNEIIPFYNENGLDKSDNASLFDHVTRVLRFVKECRMVEGTSLPNYSDGDWNDSMQPASSELKDRLVSSWTVELSYQAFKNFAQVCQKTGHDKMSNELNGLCEEIRNDFNKYLVKNGVVSGFGLAGENGFNLLLHPSDSATGIHYRLLPMIRGIISGVFTPEQVKTHSEIIEKYLKGPDGARLMDKPPHYYGGKRKYFKRAETCPSFGREIGIMYTHAHLRYCQAMALIGNSEAFIKALRQVVPVNLKGVIPQAVVRQSNCYYSSSDAAVRNRYQVNERYDDVVSGKVMLKGGWRIYSSGPGIIVKMVLEYLLGLRRSYGKIIFDPVLTTDCDGLAVHVNYAGREVKCIYSVSNNACGVKKIEINGSEVGFEREENPYRLGGAVITDGVFENLMSDSCNVVKISI